MLDLASMLHVVSWINAIKAPVHEGNVADTTRVLHPGTNIKL